VTACWGDIKGSAVAAEVRIDGIKANEADTDVLDGDPATLPGLVEAQVDPSQYALCDGVDGTAQRSARHSYGPGDRPSSAPVPAKFQEMFAALFARGLDHCRLQDPH